MVEHIKRDKNDIYGWPVIGFMFKNPTFLLLLKLTVLGLFFYGIYYGFADQSQENLFTKALFWGLFWPLFMVISLGTLGRVFCGICPHGFMGKYLTKWGLKKKMPKPLQNPMIGVMLLVIGWWALYYAYPGFFRSSFATAMLFLVMTLVAGVFYLIYADMGYCKSVCPIGAVSRGFSKVSFTWLGTYKESCSDCRSFECASACPQSLKPFTFDGRNSMTDCTLCMDCSSACEGVSFKVKKPSGSLFQKFQNHKAEVWAFILIAGSITITMSFHHALGRSAIVEQFPWTQTARYFEGFFNFGMADSVGIFAFLYAISITLMLVAGGMYAASKIMKTEYSQTFYTLGYAFAPIFIIGGLSHLLESFFLHTASDITNGFIQAFALPIEYLEPLATRREKWVHIFGIFNYIAIVWAFIIMIGRIRLMESKTALKMIAFPFAAAFIIFYLWLNFYKGYVFKTYGMMHGSHGHHTQVKEQPVDHANNSYEPSH
jgi:NAD-dependent dihydropyrimidine dehydrogenase PreA subunit